MSNTFEFAERFGFSPPFEFESNISRTGFYAEQINFENLVKKIQQDNPKTLYSFNYQEFISKKKSRVEVKDRETEEIFIAEYITDVPFTIRDSNNNERNLLLYGELNKKTANVRTDIYISRIKIDARERKVEYSVLFIYEGFDSKKNNSDKSDENRVAIKIKTPFFNDYEGLYKYLGYKNLQIENEVLNKFEIAFNKAENEPFDLAFLYNQAPNFVLQKRNIELLWRDLEILLDDFVLESKEKAIIKILKALAIDELSLEEKSEKQKKQLKSKVDTFLYRLMNSKNVFEKLYNKLNNYGFGDDNFTILINTLYSFWKLSSFVDSKYDENIKSYKGGLETLPYQSTKILGFYNNNFEFQFINDDSRLKIKAIKEEVTFEKPSKYSRRPRRKVTKNEFATYNLFHPIKLAEIPNEGELKVPDKVIPAFFLKALDDLNKWSNLEKGILLTVDIVSTATGIGNLYKLRHLRHLVRLKNVKPVTTLFKIKTAISVVEVTAGTLNIMLSLSGCQSDFCQKLQQYLFWLELASLGTDVVVNKLLKNSAKEALDFADRAGEILDPKVREILELTAGVRIKRKIRIPSINDIKSINRIRAKYKPRWNRNAAFCKGDIDGVKIDLESISGASKSNWKNKGNFEPPSPDNYNYKNGPIPAYENHTEQKIMEYLRAQFIANKDVSGKIEIATDKIFCDNCFWIIDKFQEEFPNIEVIRVFIKKELTR